MKSELDQYTDIFMDALKKSATKLHFEVGFANY